MTPDDVNSAVFCGHVPEILPHFPKGFVDLLFLDPPYNLTKSFHGDTFHRMSDPEYRGWLDSWFPGMLRLLKPDATIYFCGDWRNSAAIFDTLSRYCIVQNRITWQREKGRGSQTNWKNASEDIWFATLGKKYKFHADAVKVRKQVIAPYRNEDGRAKDWQEDPSGKKFRMTCPGNFWDDLTVPYWSMPENTDHPTQKPEKLLAKLILASTDPGDMVFDPFAGSGTSAVTAKKLGRRFSCIDENEEYCLWTIARLKNAEEDTAIQGFENGVFRDRNIPKQ